MTIEKVVGLPWWIEARKRKWLEPKYKLQVSVLEKISSQELQERFTSYPLTLELVKDFLKNHLHRYFFCNGYFLMYLKSFQEQEKFYMGIRQQDVENEKRIGIVHESCHGIYLARGKVAESAGTSDEKKVEELIETESQKFAKKCPFINSRQLFFDFYKKIS